LIKHVLESLFEGQLTSAQVIKSLGNANVNMDRCLDTRSFFVVQAVVDVGDQRLIGRRMRW